MIACAILSACGHPLPQSVADTRFEHPDTTEIERLWNELAIFLKLKLSRRLVCKTIARIAVERRAKNLTHMNFILQLRRADHKGPGTTTSIVGTHADPKDVADCLLCAQWLHATKYVLEHLRDFPPKEAHMLRNTSAVWDLVGASVTKQKH